jgi:hypothetical protein
MRTPIRQLLALGICLGAVTPGMSRNADTLAAVTGWQFMEEPTTPRLIAMGTAGTAVSTSGGFAFYNPALPGLYGRPILSLEYQRYSDADAQRPVFEGSWVGKNVFAALSFSSASISGIKYASEQGVNEHLSLTWQESMLLLDGGYRGERLALGVCVAGARNSIESYGAYALSASAGATFGIIPGKLTVGAAGYHAGSSTDMMSAHKKLGQGARLPMSARAGVCWADSLKSVGYTAALDITFRNINKQIMVPVGLEVRPVKALALRAGKRFGHDTELLNMGLGLNVSSLALDLAFTLPKLESSTELKWSVGITYTLPAKAAVQPAPVAPKATQTAPPAPAPRDSAASMAPGGRIEVEGKIEVEGRVEPNIAPPPVDTTVTIPAVAPDSGDVKRSPADSVGGAR